MSKVTVQHFAILDGTPGTYGIRCEALPGCFGGGATVQDVITDFCGATKEWVIHRRGKGLDVPRASETSTSALATLADGESLVRLTICYDSEKNVEDLMEVTIDSHVDQLVALEIKR